MTPTGIYRSAAAWTAIGLTGGLGYREITRAADFTGDTQLAVVHTHALTLGTITLLAVLILNRVFALGSQRLARWFLPIWNGGLALTVLGQVMIGWRQVQGESALKALAGISGTGHILLTVALVILFVVLGRQINTRPVPNSPATQPVAV